MDAALERVLWLAANAPQVLDAAELAVRIAVANHNAGAGNVLCNLTDSKNVFIAVTTLVQTATSCAATDARLATALHMLMNGWPAPAPQGLSEAVRERGGYTPKFPPLQAAVSPDEAFRSTVSGILRDLAANGVSMFQAARNAKIPYSTLNAWKNGVRTPKVADMPAAVATLRKLQEQ